MNWDVGIIDATPEQRQVILDKMAMTWRSCVHGVLRMHCVVALLDLLQSGATSEKTIHFSSVEAGIDELAIGASTYYEDTPLSNKLCHLDNASTRVGYKLARKVGAEAATALLKRQRQIMAPEDRLSDLRSSASTVLGVSNLFAEFWLWRRFSSLGDAEAIQNGIWDIERLEETVDLLPGGDYPPGDGDIVYFSSYGRGFDMLSMGTWDALHVKKDVVESSSVSELTKTISRLERTEALLRIPSSQAMPAAWEIMDPVIRKMTEDLASMKQGDP